MSVWTRGYLTLSQNQVTDFVAQTILALAVGNFEVPPVPF